VIRDAAVQTNLVHRAQRGDDHAFEALVRREIERLYGLAGLLLHDRGRAEDAVQEGLLRAWRDLPRLREPAKFGAWLRGLVINAAHDEGRKLGRRRGEVALRPQHERSAGDELGALLDRDELSRAFGRLTTDQRTVLALRYYLDLPSAEAAASLGMRQVTYRSKVHRALRALRAALAAEAHTTAVSEGSIVP
jgi:RNA polymerase sigma factor (sigma-70 family)